MKRLITFLLLLLLMPTIVFAKEPTSMTLEEALKEEKIEYDLEGYEESDEKPTIYLFRGKGCSHCYEFLEYVSSSLVKDYGDKFKMVTYEVWNNEENAKLMEQVSEYLGDDASGVPYIVIGDKSFNGYAESMNDEITDAIDKLADSDEKYDVLEKMESAPKKESKKSSKSSSTITIVFMLFAAVGLTVLIVTSLKRK